MHGRLVPHNMLRAKLVDVAQPEFGISNRERLAVDVGKFVHTKLVNGKLPVSVDKLIPEGGGGAYTDILI